MISWPLATSLRSMRPWMSIGNGCSSVPSPYRYEPCGATYQRVPAACVVALVNGDQTEHCDDSPFAQTAVSTGAVHAWTRNE